ncbi:hypothetical protein OIO90_002408 [Microbotryomycetes sp. JL221]|nr:hypothetical protein OIO90_002408 [Microbotryomycetes sp. JL221]
MHTSFWINRRISAATLHKIQSRIPLVKTRGTTDRLSLGRQPPNVGKRNVHHDGGTRTYAGPRTKTLNPFKAHVMDYGGINLDRNGEVWPQCNPARRAIKFCNSRGVPSTVHPGAHQLDSYDPNFDVAYERPAFNVQHPAGSISNEDGHRLGTATDHVQFQSSQDALHDEATQADSDVFSE